ncbi:RanGTP-binding protein-domain-containing protein [Absidia repens]|uniref:RanGTP-binding protein-domain-containing protein n=1 Tax=Absidia repens TaxID=90262 RepID=A0A1X2HZM0_9FUNG|nr:RanGTP-binding protein-domain-containing protein [Absidia repens]
MSLEDIFSKLAVTTVSTVSRIALSHATNAAIRNVTTYITQQSSTDSRTSNKELMSLQRQLDLKIKNLKPAVDMISHSVANGNHDLEPALEMCNDLKRDLDLFSRETETALKNKSDPAGLVAKLKRLLTQVDDTVPSLYISLRSIDSLSNKTSSSKLVQSSNILQQQQQPVPAFTVTLYSLFAANVRSAAVLTPSAFECTWKEEARKCQLTFEKQTSSTHIGYDVVLKEDTNDGLYHDPEEKSKEWRWKVDHIKRMFYTKSGKLLNIEDSRTSVLVIKLLKNKKQNKDDDSGDDTTDSTTPSPVMKANEASPDIHRDELQMADWFALEIWSDKEEDENDSGDSGDSDDPEDDNLGNNTKQQQQQTTTTTTTTTTKDGLSPLEPSPPMNLLLLESVIKLALLEVTEQLNHLNASDELLDMYMA